MSCMIFLISFALSGFISPIICNCDVKNLEEFLFEQVGVDRGTNHLHDCFLLSIDLLIIF